MATAESTLIVKRAKYQTPAKTNVNGAFSVQMSRVKWDPADRGSMESVLVALSTITNQQKAKGKPLLRLVSGTNAHVFEFDTEADRDAVVECITKTQQQGTAGSTEAAAGLPSRQERQLMLKEDSDLQEEYTQMVGGGVLSEAEFWASKRGSRRGPGARQQGAAEAGTAGAAGAGAGAALGRRAGISNRMLDMQAEMDSRMAAVGKSKLNFSLTPEMIAQIFAERPHVKRAYLQNVPHNMSEKDFWTRFARHELAKEVRRKRLLGGEGMEDVPDDNADLFRASNSAGPSTGGGAAGAAAVAAAAQQGSEKRAKLARVNPVINLLAHFNDGFSGGFGLAHDSAKAALPSQSAGIAEDLVRDINRHAEVVLAGVDALAAAAAAQKVPTPHQDAAELEMSPAELAEMYRRDGQVLEDLKAAKQEAYEQLNIHDASRYFDRLADSAAAGPEDPLAQSDLGSLLRLLAAVDPNNLGHRPMDPKLAYQVALECSRGGGAGGAVDGLGGPASTRPPEEVLAPELRSIIRREVLTVNELCRHFWACVPANTPAKADKVERLHAEADKRYDKVEDMCKVAQGPERAVIRQLLRPVRDMLDTLIERYKQDKAARNSRPA